MNKPPERTALYRMFDARDALLYIGISKDFGRRWKQHAKQQSWWSDVESQAIRWYPSRDLAKAAETVAIAAEGPIHNLQESPWEKRAKDDGTGFYVIPKPAKPPKEPKPPKVATRRPPARRSPPKYATRRVMGAYEIAELLGVSRQRVQQLTKEPGFPKPVAVLKAGSVWRRPSVEAWARKAGRLAA